MGREGKQSSVSEIEVAGKGCVLSRSFPVRAGEYQPVSKGACGSEAMDKAEQHALGLLARAGDNFGGMEQREAVERTEADKAGTCRGRDDNLE